MGKAGRLRITSACIVWGCFCLPVLASHGGGAAQLAQLSLDDLLRVEVIGASRYAQPLSETPATVTVIGEDEIRRQLYRNLGEALATVRGIYTSNDRNYTYLGVRGFNRPGDYNSRILLLTDGARRNDALYDQAHIGNEAPIEVDWIKRLEFVAGPSSALYGGNALFGIVNAVMLEGADIDGARVTVDGGSGDSTRLGVIAGQRLTGDRDWFVGFAAYRSRGQDHYYREFDNGSADGWARGIDGEKYQKLYAKYRWGAWRLTGSVSSRDKDIPTASFLTAFGQSGTRTLDQHGLVELAYDGALAPAWQQQFRVFYGRYRYDGHYRYDGPLDNRDQGSASWVGSEYRLIWSSGKGHKATVGAEVQWNRLRQRAYDVEPYQLALDWGRPARTFGLYVQDEWHFHPLWLLNLGLRYDKHSDYSGIASPRAALIYQPDADWSLKALAGSAYRPPNAYERFYEDGGIAQKANPDLRPERIRSFEIAADLRVGNGGRLGASLYRNQMRNMVEQGVDATDGLLIYSNAEKASARGIEIDGEKRWSGGYRVRASLAWQRSQLADGTVLGNSPQRLAKLVFELPLADGWTMAGNWLGMSGRKTLQGRAAGYGVANFVVSSPTWGRFGSFSLAIYNVGDRRIVDPASSSHVQDVIEQDRRQFRLRWTLAL